MRFCNPPKRICACLGIQTAPPQTPPSQVKMNTLKQEIEINIAGLLTTDVALELVRDINDTHKFFGAKKSIGFTKQINLAEWAYAAQILINTDDDAATEEFVIEQMCKHPAAAAASKNSFRQEQRRNKVAERLRNKLAKKH